MIHYRIRNTKTGKYLNGWTKEDDLGRFYRNPAAISRAISGSVGIINQKWLNTTLPSLEVVPVELIEKPPISIVEFIKKPD